MKQINIKIGSEAQRGNSDPKKTHPYMMNNWKGTDEIQETFKKISRKPKQLILHKTHNEQ